MHFSLPLAALLSASLSLVAAQESGPKRPANFNGPVWEGSLYPTNYTLEVGCTTKKPLGPLARLTPYVSAPKALWDGGKNCGRNVSVEFNNGQSVLAQIIAESKSDDLLASSFVFHLGGPTGSGYHNVKYYLYPQ